MHFVPPHEIADMLAEALAAQPHGLADPAVAPLPTAMQLGNLLDTALQGTLLEEEGRRAQFRIAFVGAGGAASSQLSIFPFRTPIPLTARALAKLTPAVDLSESYIGVYPDQGDALNIWGLIHRGEDREHQPPFFLTLTTFGVGAYLIEYFARPRLHYAQGQPHLYQGVPPNLTDVLRDGARFEGRRAAVFERLARLMRAHGHGGTLLVINDGQAPVSVDFHASCTHPASYEGLKDAMESHEGAISGPSARTGMTPARFEVWREEQRRRSEEAIQFVARLTAMDGATVISDTLRVLGFGATIQTGGDTADITLEVQDPLKAGAYKRASLADFPGNRHRSAIIFCARQPTGLALAVVASQDGEVSLFGRTGSPGNVVAIRPFGWGTGLR